MSQMNQMNERSLANRSEALLYDSAASLRLVDQAIHDLKRSMVDTDEHEWVLLDDAMTEPGGFANREGLKQLDARIRDVSSATEQATSDILDSVARAVALVEQLGVAGEADRAAVLGALDKELVDVTSHLQFQDITTQQLGRIARALSNMRVGATPISSATIPASPSAQGMANRLFDRANQAPSRKTA